MREVSVYVHLPFCRSRCDYCDFVSNVGVPDEGAYLSALERDWEKARGVMGEVSTRTVYLGGGTPSVWSASALKRVLHLVDPAGSSLETTVEMNPGDSDRAWFAELLDSGVNRFSIGAQAFDNSRLELLGRRHRKLEIHEAVRSARRAGALNLSLDFIYGTQGQNIEALRGELSQLRDLQVEHVSAYELTVAEGTPLWRSVKDGEITLPSEDELTEMWSVVGEELSGGGFERYEVSNYSLPGKRSMHNQAYWEGREYMGLGSGSHGFRREGDAFVRTIMPSVLNDYLKGEEPRLECLSSLEHARELLMLGLRTTDGPDLERIFGLADEEETRRWQPIFEWAEEEGLVERRASDLKPTEAGMLLADELASRFF